MRVKKGERIEVRMKGTTAGRARALRRSQTDAERLLWSRLRNRALGVKFRRQQPVGPYVADFLCCEKKLVVELDGGQHASASDDRVRDRWFAAQGYRVLRFWDNNVMRNTDSVLQAVLAELDVPPHPYPLPPGAREKEVR